MFKDLKPPPTICNHPQSSFITSNHLWHSLTINAMSLPFSAIRGTTWQAARKRSLEKPTTSVSILLTHTTILLAALHGWEIESEILDNSMLLEWEHAAVGNIEQIHKKWCFRREINEHHLYRLLQMVVFPANMFGCERVTPMKQTIMFIHVLYLSWIPVANPTVHLAFSPGDHIVQLGTGGDVNSDENHLLFPYILSHLFISIN